MKKNRIFWRKEDWCFFANKVQKRDSFCWTTCRRSASEVVLQVHHKIYIAGRKPWEYALSDCVTLCKGCHAREHGIIEPERGWTLLAIDDAGGLDGVCERNNCKNPIRYEHLTYHPNWGYLTVGSTCAVSYTHLTLPTTPYV